MTTKSTVTNTVEKTDKGLVIVYGTEKSKSMTTDKAYEVSEILAKTLVKNGHGKYKK